MTRDKGEEASKNMKIHEVEKFAKKNQFIIHIIKT